MSRRTIAGIAILILMLVSVFGTVAAQDVVNDDSTDVTTETPDGSELGTKFTAHPVVKVLSLYFDRELEQEEDLTDDGTTSDDEDDVVDDDVEGDLEDVDGNGLDELGPIGQEIADWHEQGVGFGVLVKLYSLAETLSEDCGDDTAGDTTGDEVVAAGDETTEGETGEGGYEGACSASELIEAFKNGAGLGQLIKAHKDEMLMGVGHVKQELKRLELEKAGDETATEDGTELDAQGMKDKQDKTNPSIENKSNKPLKDQGRSNKPLKEPKTDKSGKRP